MKLSNPWKIAIFTILFYSFCFAVHFLYTQYIDPTYQRIIADQWIFFIRGDGLISGLIPYKDFSNAAGPLAPLMWGTIVIICRLTGLDITYESDSFSYMLRIFFIIGVIFSAIIIYRMESERKNPHAYSLTLLYCFNPFFVILATFWGSDELLVPLLMILPVYLYERGNITMGTLSIFIGTGLKYWPIIFAPLVWIYTKDWRQRIKQTILLISLLLLMLAGAYILSDGEVLKHIDRSGTAEGDHGITAVMDAMFNIGIKTYSRFFTIGTIVGLGLVGLYLFYRREDWTYHRAVALCFTYLLFYQKIQSSYMVMAYPFILAGIYLNSERRWFNLGYYFLAMMMGVAAIELIEKRARTTLVLVYWVFLFYTYYANLIAVLIIYLFDLLKEQESEEEIIARGHEKLKNSLPCKE